MLEKPLLRLLLLCRPRRAVDSVWQVPDLFREATEEALAAHTAAFDALADEATWAHVQGEPASVAAQMRTAAKLCAQHERHEEAAELLTRAVGRCALSAKDASLIHWTLHLGR